MRANFALRNLNMSVRLVTGDMLHPAAPKAVAYGCNAMGAHGKGIPELVYARWPDVSVVYKAFCRAQGVSALGQCFSWGYGDHTIFGLVIQRTWRGRANLDAIRDALGRMVVMAEALGVNEVSIPRIGTGLNGLDWPDVRAVIEDVARASRVTLVVFDKYVQGKQP
jgi:O-acetyl-ADP-ribose deacetylase (regulator of RNase III)